MTKMAKETEEQMLKNLLDGGDWNVYESNILNLGIGEPGNDLLENCCSIFKRATEHRLLYEKEKNSSMLFQYGPPSGIYEVRDAIAKYLSQQYCSEVKSVNLYITSGASQGLHFILSTLIDLNGFVFVDEVTYMIALDSIKQYSTLNIVSVKLNDDGVDLSDLERLLKQKKFSTQNKAFWGMYYTIPTYHNPTGIVFSEHVCKQLIKLARKYDILITCDDVYNILYYKNDEIPKRLFAYDECSDEDYKGNVISNGSFAKIVAPGLRLGWLELPARLKPILDSSGIINSGGCLNNYTSGILASLFELGLLQQHVRIMYAAYKERMLSTCEILQKELPANCEMLAPSGGYFIWIKLPKNVDAANVLEMCLKEEHIFFIVGKTFSLQGNAKNCFRISIAFHPKEKLQDAASRLCKALTKYLEAF